MANQDTTVRNPGIIDRIEEDIHCFTKYGFSFRRCGAIHNDEERKHHQATTTSSASSSLESAILSRCLSGGGPTIQVWVSVTNRRLTSSIGPFLRTLVRLCVDPIDPRTIRVDVAFDWEEEEEQSPQSCDGGCDGGSCDKGKVKEEAAPVTESPAPAADFVNGNSESTFTTMKKSLSSSSRVSSSPSSSTSVAAFARSLAHEIHMMIRNSMGSALFLDLHVHLPSSVRGCVVGVEDVQNAMNENMDGCYPYPTVHLHDGNRGGRREMEGGYKNFVPVIEFSNNRTSRHDPRYINNIMQKAKKQQQQQQAEVHQGGSSGPMFHSPPIAMSFRVWTRMCTVRLTPVLFHLAGEVLCQDDYANDAHQSEIVVKSPFSSSSTNVSIDVPSSLPLQEPSTRTRNETTTETYYDNNINQHRPPQRQRSRSPPPMLVVCVEKISNLFRVLMLCRDYPTSLDQLVVVAKDVKQAKRFHNEACKFLSRPPFTAEGTRNIKTPSILTDNSAAEYVMDFTERSKVNNDSNCIQGKAVVVAVDLHDDAITLDGKNWKYVVEQLFCREGECYVGVIIWGFESDGIPHKLSVLAERHLQIQSRTSLNLVAAMSIVMHVVWWLWFN